jgi:hypothetical protein
MPVNVLYYDFFVMISLKYFFDIKFKKRQAQGFEKLSKTLYAYLLYYI